MFSNDVPQNVRTLFLSDLHLGFRLAVAAPCAAALDYFNAETTYLVGDTIDITRMSRVWFWSAEHQAVVDRLVALHESGNRIVLLPGNHDPVFGRDELFLDNFKQTKAARIAEVIQPLLQLPIKESCIHETLNGKRLLVMHGDQVDNLNVRFFGIPKLGSKVFDYISVALPNRLTHGMRNFFKLILTRPKKIEARAIDSARMQKLDGLVMGHLHSPALQRTHDGLFVGNTGDWVENSSAIIETVAGEFMLINNGKLIETFEV